MSLSLLLVYGVFLCVRYVELLRRPRSHLFSDTSTREIVQDAARHVYQSGVVSQTILAHRVYVCAARHVGHLYVFRV